MASLVHDEINMHNNVTILPESSFGLRVLSLPASVCLCVRPSVCVCGKHLLVRAITHYPFKLGSPNLDHMCKRPWLISLLFFFTLTFKVKFNFLTSKSKFSPFWAGPCHDSPPIEVTISKVGTKMHLSTAQTATNFGLAYLLFCAAYWSWQPRVFRRLSRSCRISYGVVNHPLNLFSY